jgi:hypothetical protein
MATTIYTSITPQRQNDPSTHHGKWVVTSLLVSIVAANTRTSNPLKESPIERHIYKVNLDNGDIKRLFQKRERTLQSSIRNNYFVDLLSSLMHPVKLQKTTRRTIAFITQCC